ncbi:hypothetical protein COU57_00320 [Candidatus Pacearchaeota archaeon CG10_big_fil_rev_8_21_14_0_10_32_14]|nr:MAG: hypothetical protein COU57_00320 [Candidatus Pacearchaeota archaeon CG10_big_fil_rev_8_21_14_0_10_32_14]
MKLALIDVKFKGKIELTAIALNELKRYKTLAVYTTTQFNHGLKIILDQLKKNGNSVVTSQPERTNREFQILGCDVYHGNLKLKTDCDAYLYIGDGKFHPNALLFEEIDKRHGERKPVFIFDPVYNKLENLKYETVEKVIKKEVANIKRFHFSQNVGVLITTKPGQEHAHYVEKLKAKYKDKTFYAFFTDNLSFSEMENFPFIHCWVNTACPRIGKEDILNTEMALINVEEVLKLQ